MSAAATAAGYLYASGRLRGRGQREEGQPEKPQAEESKTHRPRIERPKVSLKRDITVAAVPMREDKREGSGEPRAPRRTPTIQYRTRRWRPGEPTSDK